MQTYKITQIGKNIGYTYIHMTIHISDRNTVQNVKIGGSTEKQ